MGRKTPHILQYTGQRPSTTNAVVRPFNDSAYMENRSFIAWVADCVSRRFVVVFCVLATVLPVFYALWTDHVWEDFFITFKFSKNLCEGLGLVYEPGVKVHGFTSPLGTLLPALCYLADGRRSHEGALWIFRLLFCIPAFVAGGLLLIKTVERGLPEARWAPVMIGLLYLADAKSLIFSVNGMETAFMLLFLSWSLHVMEKGVDATWLWTGAAWGGLMWTRPDSCFYVAALMAAFVAFPVSRRAAAITGMLKAAAVTTTLYLPWFAWAWWYYGTPVPHTVMAKSAQFSHAAFSDRFLKPLIQMPERLGLVYAPPYPQLSLTVGEWPVLLVLSCFVGAGVAMLYWLLPRHRPSMGTRASFVFFLMFIYFAFMPFPYPWYFPPLAMLGLVALVEGVRTLAARSAHEAWRHWFPPLFLLAAFLVMSTATGLVAYQMKIQQEIIETGMRRKIGEWLKERMAPTDRVYLECLGHIGYFSNGRMLDFPGLASPEVVRLIRNENATFVSLVERLRPEWVILRPFEYERMRESPYFNEAYEFVKDFDATTAIRRHAYIPGESYLLYDAIFGVFHRKDAPLGKR